MAANGLIIVESPTKAKTIQRYVGRKYKVVASVGHIKDLPKNRLGVDVEHGFAPEYETIRGKGKVIQEIKKAAKDVKEIFLAPDPDREGEAIAWHIASEIEGGDKTIHRAMFNDLSKETVLKSLSRPQQLDLRKVEAQVARRVLDRLVGYEISPILWKKVRRGLSAGRVQSVAVRLICARQREIDAFVSEEYWTIAANLEGEEPPAFDVKLMKHEGDKVKIPNEDESKRIVAELEKLPFRVSSIQVKETRRKPLPPFITSKLQQDAYRRLRFSAKKTMVIAQQLYEGVEVGDEGSVGLITYMRTDSVKIADTALKAVREYIGEKFGKEYLPQKPHTYRSRKGAQEAHEAIRPTSVERHPENIRSFVSNDQYRLYKLIWERFTASQMEPARYDRTTVNIEAGAYLLRGTGAVMTFPGFTVIYEKTGGDDLDSDTPQFPKLQAGQVLKLLGIQPDQHFTQPPPPFTEATLVRELEEKGIGRPSTYATILSNIQDRGYVEVERGVFKPTELGLLVTDLLVKSFPGVLDIQFTAGMEENLDSIEAGRTERLQVMEGFYSSFRKEYEQAETTMDDLKRGGMPTGIECEQCGAEMVIKVGRTGPFLSCSSYPDCKFSRPYERNAQGQIVKVTHTEETVDQKCPKCGSEMVIKEGRFGRFLACSQYPDCKTTLPLNKQPEDNTPPPENAPDCPICKSKMVIRTGRFGRFWACADYPTCKGTAPVSLGVPCPEEGCDGELAEKRSRKGRVFYGCTRYPDCKFAMWNRPVAKACPQCGKPFMIERNRKTGRVLACADKECGYSEPVEES